MKKLILIVFLALSVGAQTANPSLSELEQERYRRLVSESENIALTEAALQRRKADHQAEVQKFVKAVAENHVGYQLGENGSLVKIPEPPKK